MGRSDISFGRRELLLLAIAGAAGAAAVTLTIRGCETVEPPRPERSAGAREGALRESRRADAESRAAAGPRRAER